MELIKRPRREGLHVNRLIAMSARLIGGGAIDMIRGDRPASIGRALDSGTGPPHRLEPPYMGFGKRLGGGGIVLKMQVGRVSPTIHRRHVCDDKTGVPRSEEH